MKKYILGLSIVFASTALIAQTPEGEAKKKEEVKPVKKEMRLQKREVVKTKAKPVKLQKVQVRAVESKQAKPKTNEKKKAVK